MKLLLGCAVFVWASFACNASEVFGIAKDYPNQFLVIKTLKNAFTNQWTPIDSVEIDSLGHYKCNIPNDIALIQFQIELKTMQFNAAPNSVIELNFDHVKGNENQSFPLKWRIIYHKHSKHYASDTTFWQVEQVIAKLQLSTNPRANNQKLFIESLDSLKLIYDSVLFTDHYFNTWLTYQYAQSMELNGVSNQKLIARFVNKQPINYQHPSYSSFTSHILASYVHSLLSKNKAGLNQAKKEYKITQALLKLIEQDQLIETTEKQELALICYLTSTTALNLLSKEEVNAAITQFEIYVSWPELKEIAINYNLRQQLLKPMTEAPEICLITNEYEEECLTNFRRSLVYLGFIHTQRKSCQKDLLVIETYAKKFRKIKFVLIITDKGEISKSLNLPTASNIEYLYLNQDYDVLEKYQVKSYPLYFLIDKYGYFIASPAQRPSEMGAIFTRLTAKKRSGKSYEE